MQRFLGVVAEDARGGFSEPVGDEKEDKRARRARSNLLVTAAVVGTALMSAGLLFLEYGGLRSRFSREEEAALRADLPPAAHELGMLFSDPLLGPDDSVDDPLVSADAAGAEAAAAAAAETEGETVAAASAGTAAPPGVPSRLPDKLRVKVFSGEGVSLRSLRNVKRVLSCFKSDLDFSTTGHITSSSLEDSGVLLVPGGSASKMLDGQKPNSVRNTVRAFVGSGRGYVGICAGANFALDRWNGVGISNAKLKGTDLGQALLKRTELSKGQFDLAQPALSAEEAARTLDIDPAQSGVTVVADGLFYANGPLFYNLESEADSVVHSTGLHASERRVLLRSGALTDPSMRGALRKQGSHSALIVSNRFESGRVVVSTVHPETVFTDHGNGPSACDSMHARILLNMVLHAAGRAPRWQVQEGPLDQ
jgi:hypothetical protein